MKKIHFVLFVAFIFITGQSFSQKDSKKTESQVLKPGENKVFYESDRKKLAALLYIPEGEGKFPAIVLVRPASGVKEQTVGIYAQKMSEHGFVAIAFDPKGYGESEGKPQVEDPFSIISDTKNTVTYISTLPMVDTDNIFSGGVCMGAGYNVAAASEDDRIKASVAISPYLTNVPDANEMFGSERRKKTLVNLVFRPTSFFLGVFGANAYAPVVPLEGADAELSTPITREMPVYYGPGAPGDTPNWKNKMNYAAAAPYLLKYDPFDYLEKYEKKAFFMAFADGGHGTDELKRFYESIKADDKELFIAESAGHFDLYYKPEFVDPIVNKVTVFLKKQISE